MRLIDILSETETPEVDNDAYDSILVNKGYKFHHVFGGANIYLYHTDPNDIFRINDHGWFHFVKNNTYKNPVNGRSVDSLKLYLDKLHKV